jgi:hypothetical protein
MKKRKSAHREPKLKTATSVSTDPRTGLKVAATEHRRGILSIKTRHYDMTNIAAMPGGDLKQELESIREHLRKQLERQNLPTDRSMHWVKSKCKWRPQTRTPSRPGDHHALWIAAVRDRTRPLSYCRRTAEFLWELNQLLTRPGIETHLFNIWRLVDAHWSYRLGVRINSLAESALAAERARAAGPESRKRQAAARRDVICRQAEQFWEAHPALRGDNSNTAHQIEDSVNAELRELKLLRPGGRRSAKTIGDQMRLGFGGKLRRKGQSGI